MRWHAPLSCQHIFTVHGGCGRDEATPHRNGVVYSLPSFRFIHPIFRCINRYINHPIALMKRLERISYQDIWGIIMDTFWGEFGITFHQPQNSWDVKASSYRSKVKRHFPALWNPFWKHMSSNKMPGNTKDGITSASMMRLMGPSNLFQAGNGNRAMATWTTVCNSDWSEGFNFVANPNRWPNLSVAGKLIYTVSVL